MTSQCEPGDKERPHLVVSTVYSFQDLFSFPFHPLFCSLFGGGDGTLRKRQGVRQGLFSRRGPHPVLLPALCLSTWTKNFRWARLSWAKSGRLRYAWPIEAHFRAPQQRCPIHHDVHQSSSGRANHSETVENRNAFRTGLWG